MSKQIDEITNGLRKNAVFQMSLGSKELFHSNFLSWIFENPDFKDFSLAIINQLPGIHEDIIEITEPPAREKLNIDLTLKVKSNSGAKTIIIENKVKSLPQKEQLIKYSANSKPGNHYILLSLSEPAFDKLSDDKTLSLKLIENSTVIWHFLSYSGLSEILDSNLDKLDDGFNKQLLECYVRFTRDLDEIAKECNLKEDSFFDFHDDEIGRELARIRMKDLYLKKKYESLSVLIHKKLINAGLIVKDLGDKISWGSEDHSVYVASGLTNTMGLADVKFLVAPSLILGIQIQGEQYRMVLEDSNSQLAHKIKEDLEMDFWFKFHDNTQENEIYPKGEKERFNKFGKSFFYRYVKLAMDKKVSDVVDNVVNDIVLAKENVGKVKEILKKHGLSH